LAFKEPFFIMIQSNSLHYKTYL